MLGDVFGFLIDLLRVVSEFDIIVDILKSVIGGGMRGFILLIMFFLKFNENGEYIDVEFFIVGGVLSYVVFVSFGGYFFVV